MTESMELMALQSFRMNYRYGARPTCSAPKVSPALCSISSPLTHLFKIPDNPIARPFRAGRWSQARPTMFWSTGLHRWLQVDGAASARQRHRPDYLHECRDRGGVGCRLRLPNRGLHQRGHPAGEAAKPTFFARRRHRIPKSR
jgi:hypothetical protein